MNDTESKKLHDLMQGAYERSLLALKPNNYFPSVSEFAKELATNPLLEDERLTIAQMGKQALVPLIEAKVSTLAEFEVAIQTLLSYKKIIPLLSDIIDECENIKRIYPQNSHDLISALYPKITRACSLVLLDNTANHTDILKQLVERDAKDKIIKYIFAPSLVKWYQEMEVYERTEKTNLHHSCNYLIKLHLFHDLRTRSKRIQGFSQGDYRAISHQLNSDAKDFDQALKEQKPDTATTLGFDMDEYKTHVHRIWEFLKPRLLSKKNKVVDQEDSYDGTTGMLIRNNILIPFQKNDLPAKILGLLYPAGTSAPKPISFENIYDDAIKTKADLEWFELSTSEQKPINRKIYGACRTINARAMTEDEKRNKQKFVSPDNTTVTIVSCNKKP